MAEKLEQEMWAEDNNEGFKSSRWLFKLFGWAKIQDHKRKSRAVTPGSPLAKGATERGKFKHKQRLPRGRVGCKVEVRDKQGRCDGTWKEYFKNYSAVMSELSLNNQV